MSKHSSDYSGFFAIVILTGIFVLIRLFELAKERRKANIYFINWLKTEEPKNRTDRSHYALRGYPSDWELRRQAIYKKYNGICQKCFCKTSMNGFYTKQGTVSAHVHHIIHISKGGDHALENLTLLCANCHKQEHPNMYDVKISYNRKPLWYQILDKLLG